MFEPRHRPLSSMRTFLARVIRHLVIGFVIIAVSLLLGMAGYSYFEGMNCVDAYENAAMILSGMGPVSDLYTTGGKAFAGSYALFSGIIFLVVIGIISAPLVHRFFHKFLLKDPKN